MEVFIRDFEQDGNLALNKICAIKLVVSAKKVAASSYAYGIGTKAIFRRARFFPKCFPGVKVDANCGDKVS